MFKLTFTYKCNDCLNNLIDQDTIAHKPSSKAL